MSNPNSRNRRYIAALATAGAALALAHTAAAVDLRDWGRKFATSERFVVLAQFKNQAVLDKETQLVWQRTPPSIRSDWRTADHTCLKASTGGRGGWRLPTRSEFMSLVDPAASDPFMLPTGHPFIVEAPVGTQYYWTSDLYIQTQTVSAGSANYMANIYLATGGIYYSAMTSNAAIAWCVRGSGQ